jgi:hypothetical protein
MLDSKNCDHCLNKIHCKVEVLMWCKAGIDQLILICTTDRGTTVVLCMKKKGVK